MVYFDKCMPRNGKKQTHTEESAPRDPATSPSIERVRSLATEIIFLLFQSTWLLILGLQLLRPHTSQPASQRSFSEPSRALGGPRPKTSQILVLYVVVCFFMFLFVFNCFLFFREKQRFYYKQILVFL